MYCTNTNMSNEHQAKQFNRRDRITLHWRRKFYSTLTWQVLVGDKKIISTDLIKVWISAKKCMSNVQRLTVRDLSTTSSSILSLRLVLSTLKRRYFTHISEYTTLYFTHSWTFCSTIPLVIVCYRSRLIQFWFNLRHLIQLT